MSSKQTPGPLSEQCMEILRAHEISAEPLSALAGTVVTLHDVDGEWLFRVNMDIHHGDLQTMLTMHRQRFAEGWRVGREAAFADFRALVGASAAGAQQ